jgi:hypothetical protein
MKQPKLGEPLINLVWLGSLKLIIFGWQLDLFFFAGELVPSLV